MRRGKRGVVNVREIIVEPDPPYGTQGALLRTLVLCDLVDSTALVERLGDQAAAELIRKHDRLTRSIVHRHGGHEIDKTDGFLLLFERPAQAVAFALEYQRGLLRLGADQKCLLRARVGIHVGDVVVWENTPDDIAQGAKPVEVEGLVKPVAARLMGLARPGQILLSGVAQSLAQRGEREFSDGSRPVRWMAHGQYVFKGLPEPVPVVEVGEPDIGPFRTPIASAKATRLTPWWRRPVSVAVGVLTLSIAIGVPAWLSTHSEPAIAFAERDWVVVGDLRNLTGETVFDASLDTAFRIALEQSRHVNVLSQLQVRDALARMKRPDTATIDRAIGSEIALREGAKALILPMVAEVGGQLRVSAEVIEPRTQATVYAESVDGGGSATVLASVDKVARSLRGRLGEALASVQTDSAPLDRVTTSNLDALRAYSLGARAQARGRFAEALSLYRQAESFDPEFALAILGQARVFLSGDDRPAAWALLSRAQQLREHMPAREALYLDALVATFGPPGPMLQKWRVLGSLYPDQYGAFANYALFAYDYTSQYADAVDTAAGAVSDLNPSRGATHYLRGALFLAQDKYDNALDELHKARALGGQGTGMIEVAALTAVRRYDDAQAMLGESTASGLATSDVDRFVVASALALDRGDFAAAASQVRQLDTRAQEIGNSPGLAMSLLRLSVASLLEPDRAGAEPRAAHARALAAALADANIAQRYDLAFTARLAALVAARAGDIDAANRALSLPIAEFDASAYPKIVALDDLARATIALHDGDAARAVHLLASRRDRADLFLDGIVRTEALAASGDLEGALREADAAAARRGLAFAELGPYGVQRALNVAECTLVVLRGAEIAADIGDKADATDRLRRFRQSWPKAGEHAALARRIAALEARLSVDAQVVDVQRKL
jgi:putative peptide modification system cyclase